MVIAHNIAALNAYKSLGIGTNRANKSMEKLSSGYRINRAGDDAAGLSISEKMRSQIRGLNQASRNAQDGISMIQTAEGALNEEHSILQRMRELAVQAATDTNAGEDKNALQSELEQLSNEINRIASTTEFNGMKILDGSKRNSKTEDAKATAVIGGLKFEAINNGETLNDYKFKFEFSGDDGDVDGKATISDKEITITFKEEGGVDATKVKTAINSLSDDKVKNKLNVTGTPDFIKGVEGVLKGGATKGGTDDSVYFHVGANKDQVINVDFNDMGSVALGITREDTPTDENFVDVASVNDGVTTESSQYALNIKTREGANNAIHVIDDAIKRVSEERSKYGAVQNRLEYTINNLNTSAENMQSAESRIRDVDMASEMMEMTKNNILQQAAQAMLIQANQRPQQALQLLQ